MTDRLSQVQLAKALGLSPPMIVKLKAKGMPVDSVEAAKAWREQYQRPYFRPSDPPPDAQPAPDDDVPDFRVSRARREAAEADLAELKLAEQRGELIRRVVMERVVGSRAAATREAVLQVTSRVAPLLAAEAETSKVRAMLDAELRQALDQSAA